MSPSYTETTDKNIIFKFIWLKQMLYMSPKGLFCMGNPTPGIQETNES